MTFVVRRTAGLPRPGAEPVSAEGRDPEHARLPDRAVCFAGGGRFVPVAVYDADRLRLGNELFGPAIVDDEEDTILGQEGHRDRVEGLLGLRLDVGWGGADRARHAP